MKTITEITPQIKNHERCNIYLDGEFFCGMSLLTVMKNRLKTGMRVDETVIEDLQFQTEKDSALDKAMTLLSGCEKTEKQVKDYLKGKGYTEKVITFVIDKLVGYGFLSDGDYAKRYANAYSQKKGAMLIAIELKRKGVSEATAEKAATSIGDQTEIVKQIAVKYMKNKDLDLKNKQKLYRHLLSKGFTYDEVKSAIDAFFSSVDEF